MVLPPIQAGSNTDNRVFTVSSPPPGSKPLVHHDPSLRRKFVFPRNPYSWGKKETEVVVCTGILTKVKEAVTAAQIVGQELNLSVKLVYPGTKGLVRDLLRAFSNRVHFPLENFRPNCVNSRTIQSAKRILEQNLERNKLFLREYTEYCKEHNGTPPDISQLKNPPKKLIIISLSAGSQVFAIASLNLIKEWKLKESEATTEALKKIYFLVFWGCPQRKSEIEKIKQFFSLKNFHFKGDPVYDLSETPWGIFKALFDLLKNQCLNYHPHHGIYFLSWLKRFLTEKNPKTGEQALSKIFEASSTLQLN